MKDKMKSPSLILLILAMIYVGIFGVNLSSTFVILGLCCLNGLERLLDGLKLYLDSKQKPEKELSEFEKVQTEYKLEEAKIRLDKLKRRETNPLGFSPSRDNLEF